MKKLLPILTSIAFGDIPMVDVQLNPKSSLELNLLLFSAKANAHSWTREMIFAVQGYCHDNPDKAFGMLILLTNYKFPFHAELTRIY